MNTTELKEIFGKTAVQRVCREKTDILLDTVKQYTIELDHKNRDYAKCAEEDTMYYKLWISLIKIQIRSVNKDIDKWQRMYNQVKDRKESTGKNLVNVEEVKARVQIIDLLGTPEWQSGNRAKYKCVLHEEDTASLVVYLDQNTCHCYGCGFNSDVVGLYMAMNNCDFRTALNELNK